MTPRQIKKELEKVYKERRNWQGGNGPFDRLSVNRRELVLCKQYILYCFEDAKRQKDKQKELFYYKIYKITESYQGDWMSTSRP